jgi:hypothetical protein
MKFQINYCDTFLQCARPYLTPIADVVKFSAMYLLSASLIPVQIKRFNELQKTPDSSLVLGGSSHGSCKIVACNIFDKNARAYNNSKAQKTNRMVAHNALAHKLARAAYSIMRDGVSFLPEKCFG